MPEYKVIRKTSQISHCFIEADDEEQAEQLAIDCDNWQGDDDRYDDEYEVEEE